MNWNLSIRLNMLLSHSYKVVNGEYSKVVSESKYLHRDANPIIEQKNVLIFKIHIFYGQFSLKMLITRIIMILYKDFCSPHQKIKINK